MAATRLVSASRSRPPGLLEWLQDYVIGTGLLGVVDGVLGLLGVGGLLSALLGDTAIRAASVVAALFGLLGLLVLLAVHRGEARRRSAQDRRLRLKYQDVLEERFGYAANVRSWHHDVTVQRNGDTYEKITMTLVADSDLLHYVSIWSGAGSEWPERLRRRVRIDVRTPEHGFEGGTRTEVTTDWEGRGRLVATVHFGEPVARGDEVTLIATIAWPGKAAPLMRGRPDLFVRTFSGDPVPELTYRVRLPAGCPARAARLHAGTGNRRRGPVDLHAGRSRRADRAHRRHVRRPGVTGTQPAGGWVCWRPTCSCCRCRPRRHGHAAGSSKPRV